MKDYTDLSSYIGKTPMIKLKRIHVDKNINIFAKLEFFNPSGSIKDRMAHYIICDAEKKGLLKKGSTIIEHTSGNTGASIAMIAALKGYRAILTMPDKVSEEKQNALKAYGADIIVCPTQVSCSDPKHYINTAKQIAADIPYSFMLNQYDNFLNSQAHYLTTGPEIWEETNQNIDIFIASGSTGGTISGVGRFLKEKNPNIKVIMPDPIGSIFYDFFKTGKIPSLQICNYQLEGIGENHLTQAMDFDIIDDIMQVSDQDAFYTTQQLAKLEGLLVGGSSGANVWAALEVAKSAQKSLNIVTILPDSGIKYLSKIHNKQWMSQNGFKNYEV